MEKDQIVDTKQKHDALVASALGSIIPALKQYEATQNAYRSSIENIVSTLSQLEETRKAAFVSIMPTVDLLVEAQKNVTQMMANISAQKINIQQSLGPTIFDILKTAQVIQENERVACQF